MLFKLRPRLFCRASNCLEDYLHLVDLRATLEDLCLEHDFSHNTANRPHIHFQTIPFSTQQQLWRAVPHRNNFLSKRSFLRSQLPRKPEITNFESAVIRVQEIRGFEIPMHNVAGVQVGSA